MLWCKLQSYMWVLCRVHTNHLYAWKLKINDWRYRFGRLQAHTKSPVCGLFLYRNVDLGVCYTTKDGTASVAFTCLWLWSKHGGLVRELNPGPLAPEARIIPLDQRAVLTVRIHSFISTGVGSVKQEWYLSDQIID